MEIFLTKFSDFSAENHVLLGFIAISSFWFFHILRKVILPILGRGYVYSGIAKSAKDEKVDDFESRIIANIHNLPCVTLVTLAYITTPEYYREHRIYHRHFLIALVAAWDIGYMLYDMVHLIGRRKIEKEFNLYMIHHTVSALSSGCVILFYEVPLGCGLLLMMEMTGFFVNNIYIFNLIGLRDSILFKINGIIILLFWIIFRFGVAGVYIRYCTHKSWERYYTNSTWFFFLYWELVYFFFLILNLFWFSKLVRGFIKLLKGQKVQIDDTKEEQERKKTK